jgi:phosphinothricin acetyltransferase
MEVAMIRLATAADAKAISEIYGPIVAETPISFELVPPTESEMAGRVVSGLAYAPWLVCVQGAGVAGFAYASKHRERAAYQWSVDVSVYVHERFRRHGVGRGLYTSLFALLRVQRFCAAHAGISLPNAGSVGLHEAMGFRPVGVYPGVGYKCGAWHDVGWWQLALAARVDEPPPPLTCAAAQAHPDWSRALTAGLPLLRF